MKIYYRKERFKNKQPNIDFSELIGKPQKQEIIHDPFSNWSYEELIKKLHDLKGTWRYHHNLDELKNSSKLVAAYPQRVDTVMQMIDYALDSENLLNRLSDFSAADIACSEGFFTIRYLEKGLKGIDCFELNKDQVMRFQLIKNIKKIGGINLFRIDLEHPAWSCCIGKTYNIVFCLGIVYHMENPMLFLRNVYNITDDVCIIESQTPIIDGHSDTPLFKAQDSQVIKEPGNVRYILELRPSINALIDMLLNVGFSSVKVIEAPLKEGSRRAYSIGEASVLLAKKSN